MPKVRKKTLQKIWSKDDPWSEAVRRAGKYVQKQQKELKENGLLGDGMTSAEMLCHFEYHMNCFAAEVDENSKVKVKDALDMVLQHCALSDRQSFLGMQNILARIVCLLLCWFV